MPVYKLLTRLMRVLPLALVGLVVAVVQAQPVRRCRSSADCLDGLDCTLDYCDPLRQLCFNIPKAVGSSPSTCPTIVARVTRSDVLNGANAVSLTREEKVGILKHVIRTQAELHPHRDFHKKFLRVNIVPRLRRSLRRVQNGAIPTQTNQEFHAEIIRTLNRLGDFHTFYLAPGVLRASLAVLPFTITEFYAAGSQVPNFAVSDVVPGAIAKASFRPGVQLLSWNGVPILRAVRASGKEGFGANPEAQIARGAQDLTQRFLGFQLFPEAGPITVKYRTLAGKTRTLTLEWTFASVPLPLSNLLFGVPGSIPPAPAVPAPASGTVPPQVTESNKRVRGVLRVPITVTSPINFNIFAEKINVAGVGEYGLLILADFSPVNNDLWFAEFKRLLFTQLPARGVVLDLRNNLGGSGEACQRVAQLFTDATVRSILGVVRLTKLGLKLEQSLPKGRFVTEEAFSARQENVLRAFKSGDQFSPPLEGNLTAGLLNTDTTPPYAGKVIVLVSARSYSCAEVLAANFLDTQPPIGTVGVHGTTGGGGGLQTNSFALGQLQVLDPPPAEVYGSWNTFRLERTGINNGATWEWFGVTPQKRYFPTKVDAETQDTDLLRFLAQQMNL